MKMAFENADGVGTVRIADRLDASSAGELKTKFSKFQELSGQKGFVFDLKDLATIDSAGLGALVSCLRIARTKGVEIVFIGLQSEPRMIFEITHAFQIFKFFDDEKTARESFETAH